MVNAMSKNLFQFKRNLDAFQLLSINKAERFGEREEGLLHNFKGGTFMCMTKQTEKSAVKRDYKSRMFTMIFRDKKELLQLYNAVREYAKEMSIEEAVDRAIDECIREDILKEFLERNRAEARAMSIYEYDQEEHIRREREDAFEDGRKEGREEGIGLGENKKLRELVEKKVKKGLSISEIADMFEESLDKIEDIIKNL